jgi:formylglycine-generating enzyme required for sulfatase activity
MLLSLAATAASLSAEVVIETVTVGNPGNAGELSGQGAGLFGPDRICGAVDYVYNIGTFEVTAGQYTEFLNAVADEDTYGLYNTNMMADPTWWIAGCRIERTGSSPDYSYSVAPDWADRPVNYVSWGDAARFANWMHNGQPTGAQDLTTTEDGSYFLNGATTNEDLIEINREGDATWVIPSEDEWYKAAYHYNDGVTGNYFDYPTSSDSLPSNDLIDPDAGNNATFYGSGYTIGSPYYRTEVGAHENSESPYDTFDQGGNVWEWTEAILYGSYRGLRGGGFGNLEIALRAAFRSDDDRPDEYGFIGFRVAEVLKDCNDNGIPDPCDLDCGPSGGPCDVTGCGQSNDCDKDDVINDCDFCPDTPPGVLVDDAGCPLLFGPCCFSTSTCIDNRDADECTAIGGDYLGDGLICGDDPDGDWAFGCDDGCPVDPNKSAPGTCGCGVPDSDTDGDGLIDCFDPCPNTPVGPGTNECGCSATGACCFTAGFCWDDLDPTTCRQINGAYQGDGSICEDGCGFGDFDEDSDVDLRDFAYFQRCFTGAGGGPVVTESRRGDVDACGAIDSLDYVALHDGWTGPSR